MKRLHVHVSVDDLAQSLHFYSVLFAAEPMVVQPDYAKWMLDDPRVNFAISTRNARKGLDHFGIQVETRDELQEVYGRMKNAARPVLEEGQTTCCYAQSEKSWIADPQGLPWEAFLTTGASAVYGTDLDLSPITDTACCTQVAPQDACCTPKPTESACCAAGAP
jgi:catechol 2,3-dioxygenase-like lactoylglutathione lyase family enzyme